MRKRLCFKSRFDNFVLLFCKTVCEDVTGACPGGLTLNLFSSCSITWFVVILLEMRTLVDVPNDGVKMEVCRGEREGCEEKGVARRRDS